MSSKKRKKRKQQSRRKTRRMDRRHDEQSAGNRMAVLRDGKVTELELVDYEITWEPLDDPSLRRLSPEDRERIGTVGPRVMERASDCVGELEQLVAEFPDLPKLQNYLTAAYVDAGRYEAADRLTREMYRRFPDYLFAIANYAMLCLREGRVERVPEVLRHTCSLHQLYPNRRRFHVSEVVTYHAVVAEYFWRTGRRDEARRYFDMVRELDPEHPLVGHLRALMDPGVLKDLVSGMMARLTRRHGT